MELKGEEFKGARLESRACEPENALFEKTPLTELDRAPSIFSSPFNKASILFEDLEKEEEGLLSKVCKNMKVSLPRSDLIIFESPELSKGLSFLLEVFLRICILSPLV